MSLASLAAHVFHGHRLVTFLKGVGLDALWRPILAMAGPAAPILALGLWRFRRQFA